MLYQCPAYYCLTIPDAAALNEALLQGYLRYVEDVSTRRSHEYEGRYENVYIGKDKIPRIEQVLTHAIEAAADILNLESKNLRAGLWFNAMPPGSRTLKHAHDDDDELLSAVYYVSVPADSGHLILHNRNFSTHVTPAPGMFVFFPPDVPHEVTENRSDKVRMSLGINIGPACRVAD
ncbi:MAG: hypothetical protein HYZ31_09685 [Gammaproteobacteria bacterium]|jgi:uncharacterized RmlC-like cupin family protein|nr:hypothetical protein [Gammaproteobacteria bacterium]